MASGEASPRRRPRWHSGCPRATTSTRLTHVIDGLEAAGELAFGQPYADRVAKAGSAREPIGADGGRNARPGSIVRDAPHHLGRHALKTSLRRHARAGRGKVGRRIVGIGRVAGAVDRRSRPRPSSAPSPSVRMPANLAPSSRRSLGHLIASCGRSRGRDLATASWIASAATNESSDQCSGGAGRSAAGLRRDCRARTSRYGRGGHGRALCRSGRDPERSALARREQASALRYWSTPRARATTSRTPAADALRIELHHFRTATSQPRLPPRPAGPDRRRTGD